MAKPGTFQPGNKMAVGSGGPRGRGDICTQALISQLNEIDRTTGKDKIHLLVEELIKHALGFTKTIVSADGKKTKVDVPSDVMAIREVFDRVQGKAPQGVQISGGLDNTLTHIEDGMTLQEAARAYAETIRETE